MDSDVQKLITEIEAWPVFIDNDGPEDVFHPWLTRQQRDLIIEALRAVPPR